MPCRTQRRFAALSVNSFGKIKVNSRENAYFVRSELSPSSGKCCFKRRRIKPRKPKAESEYANDHKTKATKIVIHPDSSYFMLLSIWYEKSLSCRNLPRKTMHKMPKRCVPIFLPSGELHMCWDSPEVNPGIFFFPSLPPPLFSYTAFSSEKAVGRCRATSPRCTSIWLPSEVWIILLANTTSLFSFVLWYPAGQGLLSLPA